MILSFSDLQAFYKLAVKGGFCYNSKVAAPVLNPRLRKE